MNDQSIPHLPGQYPKLLEECRRLGFTMPSDIYIGSFLKTLISSKPKGNFLELGTGVGLSLSWMVDGMDAHSKLISIDNDTNLIKMVQGYFGHDNRVELLCMDGSEWLKTYEGPKFDLIFADAWPGKYYDLEETLNLLKDGGFYVIDDMNPAPDWPEGHHDKASGLIAFLEQRRDLTITKMNWSTGVILAAKGD